MGLVLKVSKITISTRKKQIAKHWTSLKETGSRTDVIYSPIFVYLFVQYIQTFSMYFHDLLWKVNDGMRKKNWLNLEANLRIFKVKKMSLCIYPEIITPTKGIDQSFFLFFVIPVII